ncbi:hypothetical protein [Streptomyces sp. NPDC056061]
MPDNVGHYSFEEPGLTQMQDVIADFVTKRTTWPARIMERQTK